MSYKFMLSYLIGTAALTIIPAGDAISRTRTFDNDNSNDKTVNVADSKNTTLRFAMKNMTRNSMWEFYRNNNRQADSISNAQKTPLRAEQMENSVIYVYGDGRRVMRRAGTRAWRNNNPGNLRYYDFAKRNGAIGEAGNFAVFPDEETGMRALSNLLKTDSYKKLSIADALKRYAPETWQPYTQKLTGLTGLSAETELHSLTPEQLDLIVRTIRQLEGWAAGHEQQISAPQYAMLNPLTQKVR